MEIVKKTEDNSLQTVPYQNTPSKQQFFKLIEKTSLSARIIKDAKQTSKRTGPPVIDGVVTAIYEKRSTNYVDKKGAKKTLENTAVRIFVIGCHPIKTLEGREYGIYKNGEEDNNRIPYLKLKVKQPNMSKFSPETHNLELKIPEWTDIQTHGTVVINFESSAIGELKPMDRVAVHCLRASGFYPKIEKTTNQVTSDPNNNNNNSDSNNEYLSKAKKNNVSISASTIIKTDIPDWKLAERLMNSDNFFNTFIGSYKEKYHPETESIELMPEQFFIKVQFCQSSEEEYDEENNTLLELSEEAYRKYEKNKNEIPYSSIAFFSDVNKSELFIHKEKGDEDNETKWRPIFNFTIQLNQQLPGFPDSETKPSNFEIQSVAYESALSIFQIPNVKTWAQLGQCIMKHFTGILALDLNLKKTMGVTTHNVEATGRICTVLFMITRVSDIYKKIGIPISNKSEVIIFADRGRCPKEYEECINVGGSSKYSSLHLKNSKTAKFFVVTNVKEIEREKWFSSLTPEKGDSLMRLLTDENGLDLLMKKKKKGEKLEEIESIACKIRKKTKDTGGFYYEVFAILPIDEKISDTYKNQVDTFATEIESLSNAKSLFTLAMDHRDVFEAMRPLLNKKFAEEKKALPAPPPPQSDPISNKNLLMAPSDYNNNDNVNDNKDEPVEQKTLKKAKIETVDDEIQEAQQPLEGEDTMDFDPKFNNTEQDEAEEEEEEKPKKHRKEKHSKKQKKRN